MRVRLIHVLTVVLCAATVAVAQDQPKPEQMKKMYDDALAQLKAAQDRKNELAMQNEQLNSKVAELNKQIDALRGEMVELKRRDAESAERTFFLRSHYAAWREFLGQFPELKVRWELFLGDGKAVTPAAAPTETTDALFDREWPLSAEG